MIRIAHNIRRWYPNRKAFSRFDYTRVNWSLLEPRSQRLHATEVCEIIKEHERGFEKKWTLFWPLKLRKIISIWCPRCRYRFDTIKSLFQCFFTDQSANTKTFSQRSPAENCRNCKIPQIIGTTGVTRKLRSWVQLGDLVMGDEDNISLLFSTGSLKQQEFRDVTKMLIEKLHRFLISERTLARLMKDKNKDKLRRWKRYWSVTKSANILDIDAVNLPLSRSNVT